MKTKPEIGQLRVKEWGYHPQLPPQHSLDPAWVKRCKDYWELQQRTYGLKLTDFTMDVDWQNCRVVTAVRIIDILPGERNGTYTVPEVAAAKRVEAWD